MRSRKKPRIAVVRGKFLNRYEMQFYEPLSGEFDITAFGSLYPYHAHFTFPVVKLPSPMDLPEFSYKMPFLNRLFTDAHYLYGLEGRLQGYDIVHTAETYFRYTQQCLDAKKQGSVRKVIATVLENIPYNNEGIRGRRAYKARARRELDHVIALTEKTKHALLEEGADPAKISVIRHYIDTGRFTPKKTRAKDSDVTILFAGRMEEYKGIMDILAAARILTGDRNLSGMRVTWLFVGDGSLRHQAQQTAATMLPAGSFEFLKVGYRSMPDIYNRADIFVAPSKPRIVTRGGVKVTTWEEQYCTVLLEAQAAGLAIVTTTSGGIPENVGKAAILVPPGDPGALSQALARFIVSPSYRGVYGSRARIRAVNVHDIRIGAGLLRDLYTRILSAS